MAIKFSLNSTKLATKAYNGKEKVNSEQNIGPQDLYSNVLMTELSRHLVVSLNKVLLF